MPLPFLPNLTREQLSKVFGEWRTLLAFETIQRQTNSVLPAAINALDTESQARIGAALDGQDGQDSFVPGPIGPRGLIGPQGIPGLDGDAGEDGISIPGPMGPAGSAGAAGATGPQGLRGAPGSDGEDGDSWVIPGPPGQAGAAGAAGAAGPQGSRGPPGADGEDGGDSIIVVPPALPLGSASQKGIVQADGTTVLANAGVLSVAASSAVPKLTRIQLQSNSSIANNTFTNHSWGSSDIIQDDVGAWAAGNPTRFTTPSGYTKCRVTINPYWTSNSTGQRWAFVNTNGTGTVAFGAEYVAVNESYASYVSPWLTVTTGDYFEIVLAQTSGGALNMIGTSAALGGAVRAQFEWAP